MARLYNDEADTRTHEAEARAYELLSHAIEDIQAADADSLARAECEIYEAMDELSAR